MPNVQTDTITAANMTQTVSIPRMKAKPPDSPTEAARTDMHGVEMDMETAADEMENVRTH